jgi:hypothetical protein
MTAEPTQEDPRIDLRRRRGRQITRRRVNRYRRSECVRRKPGRDVRVGSVHGVHRECHSTKRSVSENSLNKGRLFNETDEIDGCRKAITRQDGLSAEKPRKPPSSAPSARAQIYKMTNSPPANMLPNGDSIPPTVRFFPHPCFDKL